MCLLKCFSLLLPTKQPTFCAHNKLCAFYSHALPLSISHITSFHQNSLVSQGTADSQRITRINRCPGCNLLTYQQNQRGCTSLPQRRKWKEVGGFVQPKLSTNWQDKIAKKRLKAKASRRVQHDLDYSMLGQRWLIKRIRWLCEVIPSLNAAGVVKILNDQGEWIQQWHAKEIIHHSLCVNKFVHAHRVHRWMQQQPWYIFESDLNNKLACILGNNGKLTRSRALFDELMKNAKVPDASTFTILIEAYIEHGKSESIKEAWKLYNRMLQLCPLAPSESLQHVLFKALASNVRWLEQANVLLERMKLVGHDIKIDMYTSLIELYRKQGNKNKISALVKEMKSRGFAPGPVVANALLDASTKDGNILEAESSFQCLIESGIQPDWRAYVSLIDTYGKAGLHHKSIQAFEQMKQNGIRPNSVVYVVILKIMGNALEREQVDKLLEDAQNSGCKPLQSCYNATMNMYLKLKLFKEVQQLFHRMKATGVRPNQAAYNNLISSYIQSGQLERAECLFKEIKKGGAIGANAQTYNLMMEAYGMSNLKRKVEDLFSHMMKRGFQVEPHVKAYLQGVISLDKQALLEKKGLTLTDEQREIIIGVMLGGAHAQSFDGDQTFTILFDFSPYRRTSILLKDHLYHIFLNWLKPEYFSKVEKASFVVLGTDSRIPFHFETISHGSFRFYALQFGPNGKPVIPKLIHRWLEPCTLAYWYMYGGCKCERTGGILLNANNYSFVETHHVVDVFKAMQISCRRKCIRNESFLHFEGSSSIWLWKLMEPHILKELKDDLRPNESCFGVKISHL